jgi:hypothetical protein
LLTKAKEAQLGLINLENGFDNLQIRIWYEYSLIKNRRLVVITNQRASWTATVYNLQVNYDGETEIIVSKEIKQAIPKSGWESFLKKLFDLKIVTLPDSHDIANYSSGDDGVTYDIEIATKNQYRFYSYWGPSWNEDKIWQARNISAILKLIEEELMPYKKS